MEPARPSILGGYRSGLRSVVGASATAYGYTLTVGPTSMLLTGAYGPPKPFEVLLFCSGAIVAFALVGALAFGGVRGHFEDHPKRSNCGAASTFSRWGWPWEPHTWWAPSHQTPWVGLRERSWRGPHS
jgi:hypothetical protein